MAPNPLPFNIQDQTCTEWCWAAVVSSIAQFVNAAAQPQQCEVVDREAFSPNLPSPGCCNAGNSCKDDPNGACNRSGAIGPALVDYNLSDNMSGQVPTANDFSTIAQQIDLGCAVVLELSEIANPTFAHVVVAIGYSGEDDLIIADPADASSCRVQSYSAMLNPGGPSGSFAGWRISLFFTTLPGQR